MCWKNWKVLQLQMLCRKERSAVGHSSLAVRRSKLVLQTGLWQNLVVVLWRPCMLSNLGVRMSILSILLFLLSWLLEEWAYSYVFAFFLRDFLRMLSDCYLSLVAAATYRWWMPANWSLRIQTVLAGSALASIKFDSEADEIATSLVFIFTVSQREFPRKL